MVTGKLESVNTLSKVCRSGRNRFPQMSNEVGGEI